MQIEYSLCESEMERNGEEQEKCRRAVVVVLVVVLVVLIQLNK